MSDRLEYELELVFLVWSKWYWKEICQTFLECCHACLCYINFLSSYKHNRLPLLRSSLSLVCAWSSKQYLIINRGQYNSYPIVGSAKSKAPVRARERNETTARKMGQGHHGQLRTQAPRSTCLPATTIVLSTSHQRMKTSLVLKMSTLAVWALLLNMAASSLKTQGTNTTLICPKWVWC